MKVFEKKHVKSTAKKLGFHVVGNFLIGTRSEDVVSGIAIDGAPSSTYIWTFILPAFDDISFMHMSLGVRALNLSDLDRSLEISLLDVWNKISHISSASQLVTYLDEGHIGGEYAEWTRLICMVRLGLFDQADETLAAVKHFQSVSIPRKLAELEASKSYGGWPAVQELLVEWSLQTDQIMGVIPARISAGKSKAR
jgi:hypothetical protein